MKSTKFLYFIIICEVFVLNILFKRFWPVWLLVLVLVFPLVLLIKLWVQKHFVRIGLVSHNKTLCINEDSEVIIRVHNKSIFAISNMELLYSYRELSGEVRKDKVKLCVSGNNHTDVVVAVDSSCVGVVHIEVHNATIYDEIRLFKAKIRLSISDKVYILPKYRLNEGLENEINKREIIESNTHDLYKPGGDVSEIFEIREYREGDKTNRIHWKLSGKAVGLLVKEYSKPVSDEEIIVFENVECEQADRNVMFETLMSLMYEILYLEKKVLVFYTTENGIKSVSISDSSEVVPVICSILDEKCHNANKTLMEMADEISDDEPRELFWITSEADVDIKEIFRDRINISPITIAFESEGGYIDMREWIIYEE